MHKLAELLKVDHPERAATRTSLERWSRIHDWQARLKVHDKAIAQGRVQALTPPQARMVFDPEFDQVEALLSAANQALQRAMNASPVVTKPSEFKALVDSAANALKLVETIKTNQVGKVSRQEVTDEISRIPVEVEKARRHDVELLVEDAMKSAGWMKIEERQMMQTLAEAAVSEGPVVAIDADEPDVVDCEPVSHIRQGRPEGRSNWLKF